MRRAPGAGVNRRLAALSTVAAVVIVGLGGLASPARAADKDVSGVSVTWSLDDESNWSAYQPGAFNFLSAGIVAKTSAEDVVTEDEWQQSSGNVSIEKEQSDGSFAPATWAGLTTNVAGEKLQSPYAGSNGPSGNRVRLDNGTGTLDADADNATITWDGAFSVIYYSGLTQWYAKDLKLEISGSSGWLTATVGGYGTSMDDPNKFVTLGEQKDVHLAQLSNVDVTENGLTVTPDFPVLTLAGTSTRAKSWPADFVAFQDLTGQSSYWYSSGGAADSRKTPTAISVEVSSAGPSLTASATDASATGFKVSWEGTGFPVGAYVDMFVVPEGTDLTGEEPQSEMVTGSWISVPDSNGRVTPDGSNLIQVDASRLDPGVSYLLVGWGNSMLGGVHDFIASAPITLTSDQRAVVFPGAPTVTADPVDATVNEGSDAVFEARASGTPEPTVRWQVSSDASTWTDVEGATSPTLTVSGTTGAQNGTRYRAIFTNDRGNATSAAAMLVVTATGDEAQSGTPGDQTAQSGSADDSSERAQSGVIAGEEGNDSQTGDGATSLSAEPTAPVPAPVPSPSVVDASRPEADGAADRQLAHTGSDAAFLWVVAVAMCGVGTGLVRVRRRNREHISTLRQ